MTPVTQPRVTFGAVGFRFFKGIELFSTQYCFAQPNLRGNGDRTTVLGKISSSPSPGSTARLSVRQKLTRLD
ncbi:MAG: hypothetical protein DWQ58_05895 [Microcystis aeruginosa TA09]|nr:MAG: hypothetical protein DWQ58_05895 [Microcystis aeruginosa TA09]